MISLGYTIAYFLRSGLPWQRTNSKNDHKGYHYDRIHAIKLQFPPRKLFAGFPDEFADYMTVSVELINLADTVGCETLTDQTLTVFLIFLEIF